MDKNELLETPHLIYVMDPMCTWCYGFAPVVKQLHEDYQDKLKLKVVVGGLRPGANTPLQADTPDNVQQHWQEVADSSGQPFNFDFFKREGFVYDTEPACRAIVAVRYLAPEHELEMASEIQQAFYKLNQDVTNPAVLAAIASQFGVEEETFLENFKDPVLIEKTQQDFMIARQLRAIAFPSLYLLNNKQISLISRGYKNFDAVNSRLMEALQDPQVL